MGSPCEKNNNILGCMNGSPIYGNSKAHPQLSEALEPVV